MDQQEIDKLDLQSYARWVEDATLIELLDQMQTLTARLTPGTRVHGRDPRRAGVDPTENRTWLRRQTVRAEILERNQTLTTLALRAPLTAAELRD